MVFEFTNHLSHIAHWTEHAPGAGTVDNREDDTNDKRCEHDAVKAEGELRHPRVNGYGVGPMPGYVEGPKQVDGLVKRVETFGHVNREHNHLDEEEQEEHQEPVAEPLRRKPSWRHPLARPSKGVAYL